MENLISFYRHRHKILYSRFLSGGENLKPIQTIHSKNNMIIKKVFSIAKLEDLGRIQLSKSFFMRDFYPHPNPLPKGEGEIITN